VDRVCVFWFTHTSNWADGWHSNHFHLNTELATAWMDLNESKVHGVDIFNASLIYLQKVRLYLFVVEFYFVL